MENVFGVIGYAIAAIAAIAIAWIKWRSKVEIAWLSTNAGKVISTEISNHARTSNNNMRASSLLAPLIGLVSFLISSINLALQSFGSAASSPLTSGAAASIAQSVCLFFLGIWLMAR